MCSPQAEFADRCEALQQQLELAEEQGKKANAERAAAQEACLHAAQQAADERAAQLSVVMETLEVLQSGSGDVQQEHVLSMTAELAAARLREVALQQRCKALEGQLEDARTQVIVSLRIHRGSLMLHHHIREISGSQSLAQSIMYSHVFTLLLAMWPFRW